MRFSISRPQSAVFLGMAIFAASPAAAEDWSGPYIGGHLGLVEADNKFIDVDGFVGPGPGFAPAGSTAQPGAGARFPYDDTAATYGLHAGYDWQFGNTVIGIEGDFSVTDTRSDEPIDIFEFDERAITDTDYLITLRGRAGWTIGHVLIYGTGGIALGRIEDQMFDLDQDARGRYSIYDTDDSFVNQRMDAGWVAGAGAEFRLARRLRVRLEGQYIQFGSSRNVVNLANDDRLNSGPQRYDVENEMLIARIGTSFEF